MALEDMSKMFYYVVLETPVYSKNDNVSRRWFRKTRKLTDTTHACIPDNNRPEIYTGFLKTHK